MRSLLFISIFLAFGCGSDPISTILSSFNNESVEYTWQADVKTLIISLINEEDQQNIALQKALEEASTAQATDSQNFVTLFGQAYAKHSETPLAPLFSLNTPLKIEDKASNEAVLKILQNQADDLIAQHIIIVQERMALFGNEIIKITQLEATDQFTVHIQGATPQIEKQIATIGKLEFWELHQNTAIPNLLLTLDDSLKTEENLDAELNDSLSFERFSGPLLEILYLNFYQSDSPSATLGYANPSNVPAIMDLLTSPTAKEVFGTKLDSIRFVWNARNLEGRDGEPLLALYAFSTKNQEISELNRSHIINSYVTKNPTGNGFAISLTMNPEGTILWERMTTLNVGKQIAISLDDRVYSAPNVNEPIPNGNVSISGGFETIEEANDFSDILSLRNILPSQLILIKKETFSD
ncbi:MAG: SecD/SecF fusion protein [Aureispira sp.]|jgi:SecD/SecF fusion protein